MYFPTRMFSRGLSPGVTSRPFRNTLGFGAKAGSPRMRLRLFERLGRLVGWRPGWQGAGSGRPGDSRADGADAGGRHRRGAGASQPGRRRRRPRACGSGPRPRPCSPRPACRGGPRPGCRGDRRRPGPRRAAPARGPAVRPCRRCRGTTRPPRAMPQPAVPPRAASAGPGSGRRRSSGPPRWRPPPGDRTAPASRPRRPQAALVPGRGRAGGGRPRRPARREGAG